MHVILIHGQGHTPLSMFLLGYRLMRGGCSVHFFGYAAWAESFAQIADRLVRTIRHKLTNQPYMIVSHSLGGVITRAALPRLATSPPRHLVMLAPPNRSPRIAKRLAQNPLYRLLTGDCGEKLADDAFYQSLPVPTVPTTIVAGTRGFSGCISPFGGEVNDSILAVDDTRLGSFGLICIPAVHAFIMNSKQAAEIVLSIIGR